MSTRTLSSLKLAADKVLRSSDHPEGIDAFLRDARASGDSLQTIARNLHAATDGIIGVSDRTIRRWLSDLDEADVA